MLTFIRDMVIGWIVYTDSGKKMANKIVGKTYDTIKNNVLKSPQFKEIVSLKDIFIKDNNESDTNKQ